MRTVSRFVLAALLLTCFAGTAMATQYPNATFPDTLDVTNIQNPASVPNPVNPDTVNGIGGLVTAFDTFPSGFAIYMQISNGGPWTGIDVFTGSTNLAGTLSLGDSVVVYGQVAEFNGGTEITAKNGAFGGNLIVRQVTTGNPLPPFHVGTVNELHELPSNPNAEQWEGGLVKVADPMRVVRNNFGGGIGPFRWARVVDNVVCPDGAGGPCDTMLIDMSTLANPAISPPAIGAIIDSVQGVYEQRTNYNIQIRSGNDIFLATPPNLASAYIIGNDSIKVVYDRDVTQASAENLANYSLASFSTINTATQTSPSTVLLEYSDLLPAVNLETLTVNGIVSSSSGLAMTTPQNASFWNKVNDIKTIQAPDPSFLSATPPCDDRSRFAGPGAATGNLVTWRCVGTADFGGLDYMQDANGGLRSGMSVFAASQPIVPGRRYLVVGRIQEFFGETEAIGTVEVIDEGVGTIPAPITDEPIGSGNPLTVGTVRDTVCDHAQANLTGEDYEGTLITLSYIRAAEPSPFPGAFFQAAGGPLPTDTDTIQVDSDGAHVVQPDSAEAMTVTGVVQFNFGDFRIAPRTDADFLFHGIGIVGIGDQTPGSISFSVYPNPARTQTLSFGLPTARDVELSVFDVTGRRVTTLARGSFTAGTHSIEWDGRDSSGRLAGAGVFFYQLKLDNDDVRTLRAVRLY